MALITGNTYPVKAQLRELGGKWNAAAKGWEVPDGKADEAREIVGSGRRSRTVSSYARFSSGAEVYVNRRGRCEDAPCCVCCS